MLKGQCRPFLGRIISACQVVTDMSGTQWLFIGLCILVFNAGIKTTNYTLINAKIIMYHECAFIIMYSLYFLRIPPVVNIIRGNRLAVTSFCLWLICSTVSLLVSPYGSCRVSEIVNRYIQCICHIVFALYAWDLLRRMKSPVAPAVLFIPVILSVLCVVVVFVKEWYGPGIYSLHISRYWFKNPPLQDHVRHTGYQVAAALAVAIAFIAYSRNRNFRFCLVPCLVILWTFLFWLGGRWAVISVIAAAGAVRAHILRRNESTTDFVLVTAGTALVGVVLAELLAVFSWNGVWQGIFRTIPLSISGEEMNKISSSRIRIWISTIETIRHYPFWGLGPQGYLFMPNRIYGYHPHSMFLQFLVEWGIAGTVPFMYFIIIIFRNGLKKFCTSLNHGMDVARLTAVLVLIALTVHGLIDGTWYHGQPSMYLALAFAAWLAPEKESPSILYFGDGGD